MKKLIITLLTLSFLFNPINCFAGEKTTITKEYLGEGIYVEIIVEEYTTYATNTKTAKKTENYKNSSFLIK